LLHHRNDLTPGSRIEITAEDPAARLGRRVLIFRHQLMCLTQTILRRRRGVGRVPSEMRINNPKYAVATLEQRNQRNMAGIGCPSPGIRVTHAAHANQLKRLSAIKDGTALRTTGKLARVLSSIAALAEKSPQGYESFRFHFLEAKDFGAQL